MFEYKNYFEAKEKFRWSDRWNFFDGSKERFNIAHECIDRHPSDDIGIRIKFSNGIDKKYSFSELSSYTKKFANYIEKKGIQFGDSIAILLFPCIELYIAMFGTFRRGAVAVMCFPLFGPEAINFRLEKSNAKAIVTTKDMISLIDNDIVKKNKLNIIFAENLLDEIKNEKEYYETKTDVNSISMIQFSSGTTGEPKSIIYKHGAISLVAVIMKLGNGLKEDDIYFCPSSPGWGHGIWFGTIAPLIFGRSIGTFSGKFNAEKVLEALQDWGVTNIAAISSHYRIIMESGKAKEYKLKLRNVVYTGETMGKDTIESIRKIWGVLPAVQYGTTEAGPISMDLLGLKDWKIKPGSLGKPMIGGIRVAILDDEDKELPYGRIGQVAIWKKNKWFKIGDSAYEDEEGYLWYVSRIDDVIISSGYTIGPIEVEEALNKHPAVEESAVIGSPDEERGNIVKAFIVLKKGVKKNKLLKEEIKQFVKTKLSKHEYPKKVEFIDILPKTPDGKIKRKELKNKDQNEISHKKGINL